MDKAQESQGDNRAKQAELSTQQTANTEAATRAEALRSTTGQWIGSADTKATALLAVSGALLAIVSLINSFSGPSAFSTLSKLLFVAFCLFDIGSIGFSALVLYPRTNRKGMLGSTGWRNPLSTSVSFFGDLSKLNYDGFISALTDTEQNRQRDTIEQAFVLATVATRKMAWMSRSVISIVLGLLCLGGFVIHEGITSWKQKTTDSNPDAHCVATQPADGHSATSPAVRSTAGQPETANAAARSTAGQPETASPAARSTAEQPHTKSPAARSTAEQPETTSPAARHREQPATAQPTP